MFPGVDQVDVTSQHEEITDTNVIGVLSTIRQAVALLDTKARVKWALLVPKAPVTSGRAKATNTPFINTLLKDFSGNGSGPLPGFAAVGS